MGDQGANAFRLCVHQRTRLDDIRDQVPKPLNCIPKNGLPQWEEMPLEQKLPMVDAPPGNIYLTRGMLGEELFRRRVGTFTTVDPRNRERIPSDKYEILHDMYEWAGAPNTEFLKALKKFGLMNDKNEVICSLQEFNRFRTYLATVYNEEVMAKLQETDGLAALGRDINKEVLRQDEFAKRRSTRDAKMAKVHEYQERVKRNSRNSFNEHRQLECMRFAAVEERLQQQRLERSHKKQERDELARLKREQLREMDMEKRMAIIHKCTVKELNSNDHRKKIELERKQAKEQEKAKWFNAKAGAALERSQREKETQLALAAERKRKAAHRQKQMEKLRALLPERIAKKKEDEKRLKDIVRKYAMRWLHRVRDRLKRANDENYASYYYIAKPHALEDYVKYLYQQSGYEKLDDIVMNILKFKEALKRQMLLDAENEDDDDEESSTEPMTTATTTATRTLTTTATTTVTATTTLTSSS